MDNSHTQNQEHISSYAEHFGTWVALILLTFMTVFVSLFGGGLHSLTVAMALLIASVKVTVVGLYFMHLKYDKKMYRLMMTVVMVLFTFFLFMVILDYLTR